MPYPRRQSSPWLGECIARKLVLFFSLIYSADLNFYRFLYQLYITIDANFKLKAKNWGAKAVPLSDSYAYIVQDADYASHLSKNTDNMTEVL